MGIQIVERYPAARRVRRFVRFVAFLIGLALLGTGLLATAVDLLMVAAIVVGGRDAWSDRSGQVAVAVVTAISVVGVWLGVRLVRGRRRLGLFLRRFGYREATYTMSFVVASGVGRRWRMVTLDDANIAPVGTARVHRRAAILLTLLGLTVVGYVVFWFFGGGVDTVFDNVAEQSAASGDSGQSSVARALGESIGAALAGAIVAVIFAVFMLMLAAVALVIAVTGGMTGRAVKAARERASVIVARGEDVLRSAATIRRNNRGVFGSRMVVCRVAAPLWQDAVRELAAVSDAVVVDVSRATDNVVWEVETMRAATDQRWVFVCHRDRVGELVYAGTAHAVTPQLKLAQLLDGQQVLLYGDTEAEQRRFARSLRNRLETVGRGG